VNRLAGHYDTRIIVLSFILTGVLVPLVFMLAGEIFSLPVDDVFFIAWRWPQGVEWAYILALGLFALFGQYFVTRAYGSDKAGIVSAVGYANIIFSLGIGVLLGDAFPDPVSTLGIICIISAGVLISYFKKKGRPLPAR
jgi:drug/metabolite transporter (DMT)-like permease